MSTYGQLLGDIRIVPPEQLRSRIRAAHARKQIDWTERALLIVALLRHQGLLQEAVATCTAAVRTDPSALDLRLELARLLFRCDKISQARKTAHDLLLDAGERGNTAFVIEATMLLAVADARHGAMSEFQYDLGAVPQDYCIPFVESEWWICREHAVVRTEPPWRR